ncbi:MAG: hypothetical protein LBD60_00440 [Puniceicoccales bacterium]|jgi:hypothetical protein|nr:hypothetical protein [Puniceicoccales bacterium]
MYKLVSAMNVKILQINMMVAMIMGNVITNASGSLYRSLLSERGGGDALRAQQDAGRTKYDMLCRKELVAESEPEDVRSWINKICGVFGCSRSEIVVYHIWAEGGLSGNESLSLNHTLSVIAQLAKLKCDANRRFLSTEAFTEKTSSMSDQPNWQRSLSQGSNVQTCYIRKGETTQADERTLFNQISLAARLPLVLIRIYGGNFLGECPGGFKDYFNLIEVYNGEKCVQCPAGLFFDKNVQDSLVSWFPDWQKGSALFFVIFKGEIYGLYIRGMV